MRLNNAPFILTARDFLLANLGPSRLLLIEICKIKVELRNFAEYALYVFHMLYMYIYIYIYIFLIIPYDKHRSILMQFVKSADI